MIKKKNNKPKWIKDIKAIGWDLDGTLYPPDSIPVEIFHKQQIKAVMEKNEWSRENAEEKYIYTYKKLGSHTKTLTKLGVDGVEFFLKFWDEIDLEKYIRKDRKLLYLLEKLANKYRLFIITNGGRLDQINRKLILIGIEKIVFDPIVLAYEYTPKPDEESFNAALKILKLKAKEVLYVGDRETADIVGAKSTGMRTCMVWGKSEEADISLPTVYDIKKLLIE